MLTQQVILDALKSVKYPGYSRDIVAFGVVKDVAIDNGNVRVELQLTSQREEVARQIQVACETVLQPLEGVRQVEVHAHQPKAAPAGDAGSDPWAHQQRIPGIGHVLAIASGKGGVGKSTLAVNLAAAMTHLGVRVGLLDCDIYGPSIPLMMGIHQTPAINDQEMMVPPMNYGIKLMSIGFLLDGDTPVIWRGPMIFKAIQQFLHQVAWAPLDYLLVDLPPGTGDAPLTLCQTVPLDGGLIVTTPQEAALSVMRKGLAMFTKLNVPIVGLVENMSYLVTPSGERLDVFGHGGGRQEAARQKVEFLGEIPLYSEIRIGGDQGVPVVVSAPKAAPAQTFIQIAQAIRRKFD